MNNQENTSKSDEITCLNFIKDIENIFIQNEVNHTQHHIYRVNKLLTSIDKHYGCTVSKFNEDSNSEEATKEADEYEEDDINYDISVFKSKDEKNMLLIKDKLTKKEIIFEISEFEKFLTKKANQKGIKKFEDNKLSDTSDEDEIEENKEENTRTFTEKDFIKNQFKLEIILREFLHKKERAKNNYLTNEEVKVDLDFSPVKPNFATFAPNSYFAKNKIQLSQIKKNFFEVNKNELAEKKPKRKSDINKEYIIKIKEDIENEIANIPMTAVNKKSNHNQSFSESEDEGEEDDQKVSNFLTESQAEPITLPKKASLNIKKRGSIFEDNFYYNN